MIKRHLITMTCLTPLSHGDTANLSGGNTRLFMRQGMRVDGVPFRVPAISENALRSVLFRAPLAEHLLSSLGILKGEIPQAVMNLLFSGGNLKSGAKAPGDEIELGHSVKQLYPSLDLLSGSTDAFVLPRSRLKLSAWLLSSEYADLLELVSPEHAQLARDAGSAFDLLCEETRTRGTGDESAGNQMLYGYETLAAGSQILLEVVLDRHTPDAAQSALSAGISNWDGFFGGQGRQGRGRIHLEHTLPSQDAYLEHLAAYGDAMRDGLKTGNLGTAKVLCV